MSNRRRVSITQTATATQVAAVTGKQIRLLSLNLVASAAVTAQWRSGAAGNLLSGAMTMAAGVPQVLPFQKEGWGIDTTAGERLDLVQAGAGTIAGHAIVEDVP